MLHEGGGNVIVTQVIGAPKIFLEKINVGLLCTGRSLGEEGLMQGKFIRQKQLGAKDVIVLIASLIGILCILIYIHKC